MGGNTIYRDLIDACKSGSMTALPVPSPTDGTVWYLWVDDAGDLRLDDEPWASDTDESAGIAVGDQAE